MHLLLYCKHQCTQSNERSLSTCGNQHILCSKQIYNCTGICYYLGSFFGRHSSNSMLNAEEGEEQGVCGIISCLDVILHITKPQLIIHAPQN